MISNEVMVLGALSEFPELRSLLMLREDTRWQFATRISDQGEVVSVHGCGSGRRAGRTRWGFLTVPTRRRSVPTRRVTRCGNARAAWSRLWRHCVNSRPRARDWRLG